MWGAAGGGWHVHGNMAAVRELLLRGGAVLMRVAGKARRGRVVMKRNLKSQLRLGKVRYV